MRASLLLLAVAACSGGPSAAPVGADARPSPGQATPGARVLFVGNSLTAGNDVPGMVAAIAAAAGTPLSVDAVLLPGASLGDHLAEGTVRTRLAGARWDFVVLQQGPSSRPDSRRQLREDVARFAPLIRAAGARPALYMVWAIQSEPEWFDEVRDSYAIAAEDIDGIFLPAGEAWRVAWRIDPSLALYSPDGLHATAAGSYAAALVIAAGLTGRSPVGAPAPDGIAAGVAATLQQAAAEVVGGAAGGAAPAHAP
ncbi:MAG TPA: hypothetical protein VK698_01345 [Kofleriaceae bacterium]|nr:hypothetical protein [Kofleriaceae bacterium]